MPRPTKKTSEQPDAHALHEREVEEGLSAIYRDEKTGDVPDLTTFEAGTSRRWIYILAAAIGAICFVLVAAWAGFSLFRPFHRFSGQGFTLTIEGPERIALGQETTYFINYQNQTSEPLAASEVRVSFPTDFAVRTVEPAPTEQQGLAWRLGALPVEGRGTMKVRGVFTGAMGTVTAIQAVGTYRPASFNSEFESLATKVLNYTDSVLDGTILVPEKALPGDRVSVQYQLVNNGNEALHGVVARVTLPEGFQRDASSTAAFYGRMLTVPIDELAAHASTTVTAIGTFASGVSGEAHVIAEAGRLSDDGTFLPAERTETSFTVLAGDLSLKMVVNGQTDDQTIVYGAPLHVTLGYENTSSEDISDVRLRWVLEPLATSTAKSIPPLVAWETLDDEMNGTRKGNTLSWSKEQIPVFMRLPAQEDGSIDVSVRALESVSGTHGLAFKATLEADIASVGGTKVQRTVRSRPLVIRYGTDATIQAEAQYYSEEGAPLGSGPLPPVVGQKTTYRLQWEVSKRFGELKDVTVRATLPSSARWANRATVEAGDLSFDNLTKTLTWTLNRMPPTIDHVTASFDVDLIPSSADANRFAQLLGETRLQATDAVVNQTVIRTSSALNTDLQHDQNAQGKGVVRKQ